MYFMKRSFRIILGNDVNKNYFKQIVILSRLNNP